MYYGKVVGILTVKDKSFKDAIEKQGNKQGQTQVDDTDTDENTDSDTDENTDTDTNDGFYACESMCWLRSDCNFASFDKKNTVCYMLEKVNSTYIDLDVDSVPIGSCQKYLDWEQAESDDPTGIVKRTLLEKATPDR